MSWIQALVLGLVQGLTEFLPVSSSGHLIIAREILGIANTGNITFEVMVHAATTLSIITALWKEIIHLLAKFFQFKWNEEMQYICKILISMIPILIVGLFFKDKVKNFFGEGLILVGSMLIVTAVLLALTKFVRFKERKPINFGRAFIIGIAQAIAVLPGLSRSGATIATGLLTGAKKEQVAEFSFLMVIIPIIGEVILDLVGGGFSFSQCGIPIGSLLCGFFTAYISGFFACKFMIALVKKANLLWFALYCAIAGITTICFGL